MGGIIYIAWKYRGAVGDITIDYDETGAFGGGQLGNIVGTTAANNDPVGTSPVACDAPSFAAPYTGSGCVMWTAPVPSRLGTGAKFRMNAATVNPAIANVMGTTFTMQGLYDITAPAGGTVWLKGNSETISWETHGNIGASTYNVDLEWNINGAGFNALASYTNQADGDGPHSHLWTVEQAACSLAGGGCNNVQVRVKKNGGAE